MGDRTEIVTEPAVEPVSLDEAKKHLHLDIDDDDDYVSGLISAARRTCELMLSRCFISTTLDQFIDFMPTGGGYYNRDVRRQGPDPDDPRWLPTWNAPIRLLRAPLLSIVSISYIDMTGNPQAVDLANVRALRGTPARIQPVYGKVWPFVLPVNDAIVIRYEAGYGLDATAVPASIKHAIKLLVGNWYENRESTIVGSMGTVPDGFDRIIGLEGWGADYS